MAVLGLRFCARAFSSCGKRGPLFIGVRGPLTIAASLVVEHRLQTHRLSSCGSQAQLLCGMWDLPRPGLEPVSPALAGRFSTTAPPGKPCGFLSKDGAQVLIPTKILVIATLFLAVRVWGSKRLEIKILQFYLFQKLRRRREKAQSFWSWEEARTWLLIL